jgi:hypothetical protein
MSGQVCFVGSAGEVMEPRDRGQEKPKPSPERHVNVDRSAHFKTTIW